MLIEFVLGEGEALVAVGAFDMDESGALRRASPRGGPTSYGRRERTWRATRDGSRPTPFTSTAPRSLRGSLRSRTSTWRCRRPPARGSSDHGHARRRRSRAKAAIPNRRPTASSSPWLDAAGAASTDVQVPTLPGTAQFSPRPSQAVSQHTPSAQNRVEHCAGVSQGSPGSRGTVGVAVGVAAMQPQGRDTPAMSGRQAWPGGQAPAHEGEMPLHDAAHVQPVLPSEVHVIPCGQLPPHTGAESTHGGCAVGVGVAVEGPPMQTHGPTPPFIGWQDMPSVQEPMQLGPVPPHSVTHMHSATPP
jgi:hypothetical protein